MATRERMIIQVTQNNGGRLPVCYRVVEAEVPRLKHWFRLIDDGESYVGAFIRAFDMFEANTLLKKTVELMADENLGLSEGVHFDNITVYFEDWQLISDKGLIVTINDANKYFNEWYVKKSDLLKHIGFWRYFSFFVWRLFRDKDFRDWCREYIS